MEAFVGWTNVTTDVYATKAEAEAVMEDMIATAE
jgi:hypothetical protein